MKFHDLRLISRGWSRTNAANIREIPGGGVRQTLQKSVIVKLCKNGNPMWEKAWKQPTQQKSFAKMCKSGSS